MTQITDFNMQLAESLIDLRVFDFQKRNSRSYPFGLLLFFVVMQIPVSQNQLAAKSNGDRMQPAAGGPANPFCRAGVEIRPNAFRGTSRVSNDEFCG
jgi:hypothetical protein